MKISNLRIADDRNRRGGDAIVIALISWKTSEAEDENYI
jgi:hypothetical protein